MVRILVSRKGKVYLEKMRQNIVCISTKAYGEFKMIISIVNVFHLRTWQKSCQVPEEKEWTKE